MTTIYAVSRGEYSDYSVVALFSTREAAEAFIAAVPDSGYSGYNKIEEYELDPPVVDLLRQGQSVWHVLMLRDGTTESVERKEVDPYTVESAGKGYVWRRASAAAYRGSGVPDCLTWNVWAKDGAHAVKIVNEKRVQLIAAGQWD